MEAHGVFEAPHSKVIGTPEISLLWKITSIHMESNGACHNLKIGACESAAGPHTLLLAQL